HTVERNPLHDLGGSHAYSAQHRRRASARRGYGCLRNHLSRDVLSAALALRPDCRLFIRPLSLWRAAAADLCHVLSRYAMVDEFFYLRDGGNDLRRAVMASG